MCTISQRQQEHRKIKKKKKQDQENKELKEGEVEQQLKEPGKLLWFEHGLSTLKLMLKFDGHHGGVERWGLVGGAWVMREKPS